MIRRFRFRLCQAAVVWFGLLGSLLVRHEDRELPVPAPKQRVILAALLLSPGTAVSGERLSELVWDSQPPGGSAVTLRSYLKRLRQVLGPAAGSRIITADPGYLIEAAPDEIDVACYEALCGLGEAAVHAGQWDRAAELLSRAQGLWRGSPLADIPCPALQLAEGHRLQRLRLDAIGWRIEADLQLGRCGKVVPELRALTAEHPLHEPFHFQLMVALYRSGRQADALAAYRRVRGVLVDELGIEPGGDLRLLHQQILRGEAQVASTPGSGGRAAPARLPPPRQLPLAIPHFVGRSAELRQLARLLNKRPGSPGRAKIAVVAGMAGVGKTALAVHWANEVAGAFPDGQLYLNLNGFGPVGAPVSQQDAVSRMLEAMQVPAVRIPASLEGRIGLYRTLLSERRILVVLDNAKDADQVRPLLPGGSGCTVVITSRSGLTGLVAMEGARAIFLNVLTEPEARRMVAQRLGPGRTAADRAAADQLIRACARLPLALAIATALVASRPGQSLALVAANLARADRRLDDLDTGDASTSLRAVFTWSCRALTPRAYRLFRLLAEHPGPDISAVAAASLAGLPQDEADQALTELAASHLVNEDGHGRFAFHDLLRLYAAEQLQALEESTERRAASRRMLDYYLHTARSAAVAISPTREMLDLEPAAQGARPAELPDEDQAVGWLKAEHQVLIRVISYAAGAGFDIHAWQLAWAMTDYLDRDGHWYDWAASQRIALAAATRLGDAAAQARAHRYLGRACSQLQDYDEALAQFSCALAQHRLLGDLVGEAGINADICHMHELRGEHDKALDCARLALSRYRQAGHLIGEASALNSMGWNYALSGNYGVALGYCKDALELCVKLGYTRGEGLTWDSLALVHLRLGRPAEAIACYGRSLKIIREQLGDRYTESLVLSNLGCAHKAAGDVPAAVRAWQEALDILDDLNHPDSDEVRAKISDAALSRGLSAGSEPVVANGRDRDAG